MNTAIIITSIICGTIAFICLLNTIDKILARKDSFANKIFNRKGDK